MSHDIKNDVNNYASQLVYDDSYDSTKFNVTLREQNNIGNQSDDNDCLKVAGEDFSSTEISDKSNRILIINN